MSVCERERGEERGGWRKGERKKKREREGGREGGEGMYIHDIVYSCVVSLEVPWS